MSDTTGEFSFLLKPALHGVGVFAAHDIAEGARLDLFGRDEEPAHWYRTLKKEEVPEYFRQFCLDRDDGFICPPDFRVIPVGWYLNHSKEPNAKLGPDVSPHRKLTWYAARFIKEGEEILIDYNQINEVSEADASYYRTP